ncbi:unnamed protein product [Rhizophagus irregularis]|nr:unnamed protein product [Rhizophagus irregularis]
MWECTTGCKPFANIEHDQNLIYDIIDGKRPEITEDTPELLANLMKRCWDSDPKNRPTAWEIKNSIYSDSTWKDSNYEALRLPEAEQKRLFSVNSLNTKQGYISREYEFDIKGSQSSSLTHSNIEIQSLSSPSIYSIIRKFLFGNEEH